MHKSHWRIQEGCPGTPLRSKKEDEKKNARKNAYQKAEVAIPDKNDCDEPRNLLDIAQNSASIVRSFLDFSQNSVSTVRHF